MDVGFYHLQTTALDAALPQLLSKCLQRDWRVVVQFGAEDRMRALDDALWMLGGSTFLPHAAQGATRAERQPIWLSTGNDNPNGARARFYVEGAEPSASDNLDPYARVVIMFDGTDEPKVADARTLWRRLKQAGHSFSYWKQAANGTWEQSNAS